jgi:Holliday junction resolvasome RuvABC endonuclease subunit
MSIADTDAKTLYVCTVSPRNYTKVKFASRYQSHFHNTHSIAQTIIKKIIQFRKPDLVIVESLPFGMQSYTDLLILHGSMSNKLLTVFGIMPTLITPKQHKAKFTGNIKANKQQSIDKLLELWPSLQWRFAKLDDIADSVAMLSMHIDDLSTYKLQIL